MDKEQIDLSKPAFGEGSQKLQELMDTRTPDAPVEEKAEVESEQEPSEPSVEETKVPYSRFKKFHDEAKQAREEAEYWRQQAEQIESQRASRFEEPTSDMPSDWIELYGNSEASEKAWKIQQRREQAIEQRAYEAGQRGALELEQQQEERMNSNVAVIDENFEDLSAYVGRNLTEKEQSAILDIVDDYTAKDAKGNYQGAIMPFDKAWEIYELKQGKSSQSRQARDKVASLSGNHTQGDSSVQAEKDKNWNPLDWNAYRNRL